MASEASRRGNGYGSFLADRKPEPGTRHKPIESARVAVRDVRGTGTPKLPTRGAVSGDAHPGNRRATGVYGNVHTLPLI